MALQHKRAPQITGRREGTCVHPYITRVMHRYFPRRVSANKSPPRIDPWGAQRCQAPTPNPHSIPFPSPGLGREEGTDGAQGLRRGAELAAK